MGREIVLDQDAGFFKDEILDGLGLFRIAASGTAGYDKYPNFWSLCCFGHIAGRLLDGGRASGDYGAGGRDSHSLQETSSTKSTVRHGLFSSRVRVVSAQYKTGGSQFILTKSVTGKQTCGVLQFQVNHLL